MVKELSNLERPASSTEHSPPPSRRSTDPTGHPSIAQEAKVLYEDADEAHPCSPTHSGIAVLCPIAEIQHRWAVSEEIKMARKARLAKRRRKAMKWTGISFCIRGGGDDR